MERAHGMLKNQPKYYAIQQYICEELGIHVRILRNILHNHGNYMQDKSKLATAILQIPYDIFHAIA